MDLRAGMVLQHRLDVPLADGPGHSWRATVMTDVYDAAPPEMRDQFHYPAVMLRWDDGDAKGEVGLWGVAAVAERFQVVT